MSVSAVLNEVESAGIALRLDGEKIRISFPDSRQREELAGHVAFLRAHRDELAEFLRVRAEGDSREAPYIWGTDRISETRDDYGRRAHVAIEAICVIQAPEGLIVWLREHSPILYERLTCDLPNEISRAWNSQISFKDFDALCSRLVDTFQMAAELYRNSKRTPQLIEQPEKPNPGRNFQA